jgi:signal peptidase I
MNKKILKEVLSYALIIVLVLLFRIFLYSPIIVKEASMNPTLYDGDIMILNKIGYRINGIDRFDVIVFNYGGEELIKRVIGLPGDYVEYKDNKLYINGKYIEEKFDKEDTNDFILEAIGYSIIPEGKYFVLGDNRPISKDSRMIGLIDKKDILGYTNVVIFPFNDIKKVN